MSSEPVNLSLLSTLVRHYDDLVDHVRRRFGDRGFAREVVHDVCVQLLEKREKHGVRTPLALLRKISHDQASSRYRSDRRRLQWIVPLAPDEDAICPAPTPDRQHQGVSELDLLEQAINGLAPRCREVFILHKVYEVSQAEVAQRMGISIKTVEKHLRLGMAACREQLERSSEPA